MTGDEPDYRFTLANERTFLAYLRTSLAFYAGGLSAVQFLDLEQRWVSRTIGVVLVLAGLASTIGAYVRWKQNLAAMRERPAAGQPAAVAAGNHDRTRRCRRADLQRPTVTVVTRR